MILAHNGYVYCEIWKGMYGLPQSGILANQKLVQRLEPKGYALFKHTPGLWRYKWIPTTFSLVVDDFVVNLWANRMQKIKYRPSHNIMLTNLEGQRCCGISIKWNYQKVVVDLSMSGYVQAVIHKFEHSQPTQK